MGLVTFFLLICYLLVRNNLALKSSGEMREQRKYNRFNKLEITAEVVVITNG